MCLRIILVVLYIVGFSSAATTSDLTRQDLSVLVRRVDIGQRLSKTSKSSNTFRPAESGSSPKGNLFRNKSEDQISGLLPKISPSRHAIRASASASDLAVERVPSATSTEIPNHTSQGSSNASGSGLVKSPARKGPALGSSLRRLPYGSGKHSDYPEEDISSRRKTAAPKKWQTYFRSSHKNLRKLKTDDDGSQRSSLGSYGDTSSHGPSSVENGSSRPKPPVRKTVSFAPTPILSGDGGPVSAHAIASGPGSKVEYLAQAGNLAKAKRVVSRNSPAFIGNTDIEAVKAKAKVLSDDGRASATATGKRVNAAIQTYQKGGLIEYRAGNHKPIKERVEPNEYRYVSIKAQDLAKVGMPTDKLTITTHLYGSGRCSARACSY